MKSLGIAFLSGGQTEIEATQNLNEINKINNTNFLMSFSYGRALQQSALKNWAKDIKDTNNTQKIFNHRSKMNGLSTSAKWSMDLEKQLTSLFKIEKIYIFNITSKDKRR